MILCGQRLFLLCALLCIPMRVTGQTLTRQEVPKGEITGLEMAVEGTMQVVPGGRVQWFVTVYEIVKGRKLRPAKGVKLEALVSYQRAKAVVETQTDAFGRASIGFDVPANIEGSFRLVVQAKSPKGIARKFDVSVAVAGLYKTELFVESFTVAPGHSLRVWGRVLSRLNHHPVVNQEVRLSTKADKPSSRLGPAQVLRTNAQGLFEAIVRAPAKGHFVVTAAPQNAPLAREDVYVKVPEGPQLVVSTSVPQAVVATGTTVDVEVVVRTPEGRPVSDATLSGVSIPVSKRDGDGVVAVRTDKQGRATVPWKVQTNSDIEDVQGEISALREGVGSGSGRAKLRVTRVPVLLSWSVVGGALVPGLAGQVVLRAFHPDGRPWANLSVLATSSRLEDARLTTGNDGVVVWKSSVSAAATKSVENTSSCHGPTLAEVKLRLAGHDKTLCLPVDPDATLVLQSKATLLPGMPLALNLQKAPSVRRLPVVVTVLAKNNSMWEPVAQTILAAAAKTVELQLPKSVRGALWVRARPMVGAQRREIRGGSAVVWALGQTLGPEKLGVTLQSEGAARIRWEGKSLHTESGFAIALPLHRGRRLLGELLESGLGRPKGNASNSLWLGYLAGKTPLDTAVSAVLQQGVVTTLAMPGNSVALGLLRDPWRTQARFVRGRLGRILFALEAHVSSRLPDQIGDVAIRGPRGWRFNRQILSAVADTIGVEAIAGLDGSPLTIQELQEMGREITYDNVARRITRKRVLNALVGLRKFVNSQQLDYAWARRGDPSGWLLALLEWEDPDGEFSMEREELFDGWGTPLVLRKARGGRARFRFLEPVVGFEVISAGPDKKFGTRDDVFDPFARVLSQGSLYGEAVGEEALLARLGGVELGRATIAALGEAFELDTPMWDSSELRVAKSSWNLPRRAQQNQHSLKVQTEGTSQKSLSRFYTAKEEVRLQFPANPKHYLVVAGRYFSDGTASYSSQEVFAGVPVLVHAQLPTRLRPKERVEFPIRIVGLGKEQEVRIEAAGERGVFAQIVGDSHFVIGAGQVKEVVLRVEASEVGEGSIVLTVKGRGGVRIRSYHHSVTTMWSGALRAQHDARWIQDDGVLKLHPPKGAKPIRSFLTVSAPRDILKDRGFARVAENHPELLAWGYRLRGQALPTALEEALLRGSNQSTVMPALSKACRGAGMSMVEERSTNRAERGRAFERLRALQLPVSMRERAALLVALASGAPTVGDSAKDGFSSLIHSLRNDGWHAPKTQSSKPTVLARLAAGLLLVDTGDVPAQEMVRLAKAALVPGKRGGKRLPGEKGDAVDGWIGTLALAIAAHQLGDDPLVSELVAGITPRMYLGMQGAKEPAFWLLAASAYGVLGVRNPEQVRVVVNGKSSTLPLKDGSAVLQLPSAQATVRVQSDSPLMARVEARYVIEIRKSSASSLEAKIIGDVGVSGGVAALEIAIENTGSEELASPVVEVNLPSPGVLSAESRAQMEGSSRVLSVAQADKMGIVRIRLASLAAKESISIPLPIRWKGRGLVKGLSVSAYNAKTPWKVSSTPARTIRLKPAKKENWK